MPNSYNKPWLSTSQQLTLLKQRGLLIDNEPQAQQHLHRIGYYRLSGYSYPFRLYFRNAQGQFPLDADFANLDSFKSNTRFQTVVDIYVFDKKLRILLGDALERVEVALRVDIAYLLGQKDAFAHTTTQYLKQGKAHAHPAWFEHYQKLEERSTEEFVKRFKEKHTGELPIWMAVELWDFGTLSRFWSMMADKDKKAIANKYGLNDRDYALVESWLRALGFIRNVCAHHGRLWNRNMASKPKVNVATSPKWNWLHGYSTQIDKPFVSILILAQLLRMICPNTQWHERFKQLMSQFPAHSLTSSETSLEAMGLLAGWEALV